MKYAELNLLPNNRKNMYHLMYSREKQGEPWPNG